MIFEFATASQILFGAGVANRIGEEARRMGKHAFLVTGLSDERAEAILSLLQKSGVKATRFRVSGEPEIGVILQALAQARQTGCDLVLGYGGGSVLDAGKAIAAWLTNPGDPLSYLEVVGEGKSLEAPSMPYVAVPTTAGTGSEVTRNAVLGIPSHRTKVSLRGRYMLPRLAVVDPELTRSLPPEVTARTGLDALTQLVEPYVCNTPNPLVDALCLEGIRRVGKSLYRAYADGSDIDARTDMCLASMFSGMALANAKLGAAHGFAAPLGGMFAAAHGEICGRLLGPVMAANYRALSVRQEDSTSLARFHQVAKALVGDENATLPDAVDWVERSCQVMRISRLGDFGISRQDFPVLIEKARQSSSMKGNPVQLGDQDLIAILENSL